MQTKIGFYSQNFPLDSKGLAVKILGHAITYLVEWGLVVVESNIGTQQMCRGFRFLRHRYLDGIIKGSDERLKHLHREQRYTWSGE